jgi:hypothetical protein
VRRIAVVTIRREPCACWLARRLAGCGAEVWLVSQSRMRVETDSWAYFRRFRARYGLRLALDYLLLFLVKTALGWTRRAGRPGGVPVLDARRDIGPDEGIRLLEIDDINRGPGHAAFAGLEPDLVLLAGAPVLGRAAIGVARLACINPHCGITPAYAGGSPFDWAIHERRFDDIGYTIHLVVPVVDAGPVLVQERIAWDPQRPNGQLWPILAQAMYERLAAIALALARGAALEAVALGPARVLPPAGLCARLLAEARRRAYARRRRAT